MQKVIGLYYFSGTGNTEYVVQILQIKLQSYGFQVDILKIEEIFKQNIAIKPNEFDIIGLAYPIHNWGPALLALQFTKNLSNVENKPIFIIETGAGPQGAALNEASTLPLIRNLESKGYRVNYEYQFSMPSNWLYCHPVPLQRQLCKIVELKAEMVSKEISSLTKRRKRPGLLSKLLIAFGWYPMPLAASIYGRILYASAKCNNCGKCISGCPVGNIQKNSDKIKFGWRCTSCMRCAYLCPVRAIVPRIGKMIVLKNWYGAKALLSRTDIEDNFITEKTTGFNARYKKYLLQKDNIA